MNHVKLTVDIQQDFPFSISILDSLPPTVQLDSKASISYELVASVHIEGDRRFLGRKGKGMLLTSKAPIIIDKYELLTTWPIYNQPETRHMSQDGVQLTVDRKYTCLGPGDWIVVNALVTAGDTVTLEGLEMSLAQTTIFKAKTAHSGKAAPQSESVTVTVAEAKVPLNVLMYPGQQKHSEISCMLDPRHTTPTVHTAQHIDVTYTLKVKAAFGMGHGPTISLPVIVSNWTRYDLPALSRFLLSLRTS